MDPNTISNLHQNSANSCQALVPSMSRAGRSSPSYDQSFPNHSSSSVKQLSTTNGQQQQHLYPNFSASRHSSEISASQASNNLVQAKTRGGGHIAYMSPSHSNQALIAHHQPSLSDNHSGTKFISRQRQIAAAQFEQQKSAPYNQMTQAAAELTSQSFVQNKQDRKVQQNNQVSQVQRFNSYGQLLQNPNQFYSSATTVAKENSPVVVKKSVQTTLVALTTTLAAGSQITLSNSHTITPLVSETNPFPLIDACGQENHSNISDTLQSQIKKGKGIPATRTTTAAPVIQSSEQKGSVNIFKPFNMAISQQRQQSSCNRSGILLQNNDNVSGFKEEQDAVQKVMGIRPNTAKKPVAIWPLVHQNSNRNSQQTRNLTPNTEPIGGVNYQTNTQVAEHQNKQQHQIQNERAALNYHKTNSSKTTTYEGQKQENPQSHHLNKSNSLKNQLISPQTEKIVGLQQDQQPKKVNVDSNIGIRQTSPSDSVGQMMLESSPSRMSKQQLTSQSAYFSYRGQQQITKPTSLQQKLQQQLQSPQQTSSQVKHYRHLVTPDKDGDAISGHVQQQYQHRQDQQSNSTYNQNGQQYIFKQSQNMQQTPKAAKNNKNESSKSALQQRESGNMTLQTDFFVPESHPMTLNGTSSSHLTANLKMNQNSNQIHNYQKQSKLPVPSYSQSKKDQKNGKTDIAAANGFQPVQSVLQQWKSEDKGISTKDKGNHSDFQHRMTALTPQDRYKKGASNAKANQSEQFSLNNLEKINLESLRASNDWAKQNNQDQQKNNDQQSANNRLQVKRKASQRLQRVINGDQSDELSTKHHKRQSSLKKNLYVPLNGKQSLSKAEISNELVAKPLHLNKNQEKVTFSPGLSQKKNNLINASCSSIGNVQNAQKSSRSNLNSSASVQVIPQTTTTTMTVPASSATMLHNPSMMSNYLAKQHHKHHMLLQQSNKDDIKGAQNSTLPQFFSTQSHFAPEEQPQLSQKSPTSSRIHKKVPSYDIPNSLEFLEPQVYIQAQESMKGAAADWCQKLREIFAQQENLVLKLHLEFKKKGKVESIVKVLLTDIEQLVKKVSSLIHQRDSLSLDNKDQPFHQQEGLLFLVKQNQRAYLSGLSLVWIIQREEQQILQRHLITKATATPKNKLLDYHSTLISQLLDSLSQCAHLMQEKMLSAENNPQDQQLDNSAKQTNSHKRIKSQSKGRILVRSAISSSFALIKKIAHLFSEQQNLSNEANILSPTGMFAIKKLVSMVDFIQEGSNSCLNLKKVKQNIFRLLRETDHSWLTMLKQEKAKSNLSPKKKLQPIQKASVEVRADADTTTSQQQVIDSQKNASPTRLESNRDSTTNRDLNYQHNANRQLSQPREEVNNGDAQNSTETRFLRKKSEGGMSSSPRSGELTPGVTINSNTVSNNTVYANANVNIGGNLNLRRSSDQLIQNQPRLQQENAVPSRQPQTIKGVKSKASHLVGSHATSSTSSTKPKKFLSRHIHQQNQQSQSSQSHINQHSHHGSRTSADKNLMHQQRYTGHLLVDSQKVNVSAKPNKSTAQTTSNAYQFKGQHLQSSASKYSLKMQKEVGIANSNSRTRLHKANNNSQDAQVGESTKNLSSPSHKNKNNVAIAQKRHQKNTQVAQYSSNKEITTSNSIEKMSNIERGDMVDGFILTRGGPTVSSPIAEKSSLEQQPFAVLDEDQRSQQQALKQQQQNFLHYKDDNNQFSLATSTPSGGGQLTQQRQVQVNGSGGSKRRVSQPDFQKGAIAHKVSTKKAKINTNSILPPLNFGIQQDSQLRQYTLVLDLDETLVHFDQRRRNYKARPHALAFIKEMSKYYELVIFTAGLKEYADWILNDFDRSNFIKYRLYRNSCRFRKGVYVKDLSRLGRDLTKTIIVDNIAENFEVQPDNGIHILSWFSSPSDCELIKLEPILRSFVENQVSDIRLMIKQYFRHTIHAPTLNLESPNLSSNKARKSSVQQPQSQGVYRHTAANRANHSSNARLPSQHSPAMLVYSQKYQNSRGLSHDLAARNQANQQPAKSYITKHNSYSKPTNTSSNASQVLQGIQLGRIRGNK